MRTSQEDGHQLIEMGLLIETSGGAGQSDGGASEVVVLSHLRAPPTYLHIDAPRPI